MNVLAIRSRRSPPRVVLALGCSVAIAACGASGNSAGTTTSGSNPGLKFSQCMRSHGVPHFPDPGPSGGGVQFQSAGINPQSPSFEAAQQSCGKLLGPNNPRTPPTAAEKAAGLRFAQCMRTHGVPDFPDPTSSVSPQAGPALFLRGMQFPVGSAINPVSPAFRQAAGACGLRLPKVRLG
jgi:hypothetical protein